MYGLVQNGFRAIQKRFDKQSQEPSPSQAPFSQALELSSQSSLLFQTSNACLSSVGAGDPKTPNQPSVQLPSTDVTGSGQMTLESYTYTPTTGPVLLPPNPFTTVAANYRRTGVPLHDSPKSAAKDSRKRARGADMMDAGSTLEGNMMKRLKKDQ